MPNRFCTRPILRRPFLGFNAVTNFGESDMKFSTAITTREKITSNLQQQVAMQNESSSSSSSGDVERTSPKRPRSNSDVSAFNSLPIVPVSPNRLYRDWDCPDSACCGQIEVFRAPNSTSDKPAFARCSEAQSLYGKKCTLPMLFAKKSSTCQGCKYTICEVFMTIENIYIYLLKRILMSRSCI